MKNKLVSLYLFVLPSIVFAQSAVGLPEDSGSFLDKIGHYLSNIPAASIVAVLTGVEILLRLVPTANPASLLVPAKKILDMLVYILSFVSDLLSKLVIVANRVK